jgi:hypothetical protein
MNVFSFMRVIAALLERATPLTGRVDSTLSGFGLPLSRDGWW